MWIIGLWKGIFLLAVRDDVVVGFEAPRNYDSRAGEGVFEVFVITEQTPDISFSVERGSMRPAINLLRNIRIKMRLRMLWELYKRCLLLAATGCELATLNFCSAGRRHLSYWSSDTRPDKARYVREQYRARRNSISSLFVFRWKLYPISIGSVIRGRSSSKSTFK